MRIVYHACMPCALMLNNRPLASTRKGARTQYCSSYARMYEYRRYLTLARSAEVYDVRLDDVNEHSASCKLQRRVIRSAR